MRTARLRELQSPCRLCPRECGVLRAEGELGRCGVGVRALVRSAGPHHGEESCLVGRGGSGTIFLGGCNLLCLYCQNEDISHGRQGRPMTPAAIAESMLSLVDMGCENVNFVTPTHFAPQLAEAVAVARAAGLTVPVVWNCGGYESVDALEELQGVVDIYMPDCKTQSSEFSEAAFGARDYPERARAALVEMHRQVGDLTISNGLATRGLLVRHLVMPGMVADSKACLDFLARKISGDTFVNVMGQYRPCYRASELPGLSRRVSPEEIGEAKRHARSLGLRLDER